MEISSAHHQEFTEAMANHPLEEVLGGCPKAQQQQERKVRPHPEQALRCPRCDSTNTKFCYYNNYSLSQPRYFCKGCRRYWTQGGSLRNVPVGGGCRKNKRSSSSSSSKKAPPDQALITTTNPNPLFPTLPPLLPPLFYDPNDLTLAFARLHKQPTTPRQLGLDDHPDRFLLGNHNPNPNATNIPTSHTGAGFLDILRSGFLDSTTTTTTATTGFHNLYYGFGSSGSVEEVDGGVGGEEVMLPFEGGLGGATAAGSQGSSCKTMDGGENKVLMGLPWQLGGDGSMNVDSGREYWNGVGSSWYGLINSSLM